MGSGAASEYNGYTTDANGNVTFPVGTLASGTYTIRVKGSRNLSNGAGPGAVWQDIWPLLVIGAIAVPLGLAVFRRGERYAKQHGRLKRSG